MARSTKRARLYRQVEQNRKNCKFEWLSALLESYGYVQRPTSGTSHRIFKRPRRNPISVPVRKPVKERYVREVLDAIDDIEREEPS
jgi:predicted RNA binding protein YcfA (HicA-like mRNA interferase family)